MNVPERSLKWRETRNMESSPDLSKTFREFLEEVWLVTAQGDQLKQHWRGPRDQHSPSRPYLKVMNPTHKESVKGSN